MLLAVDLYSVCLNVVAHTRKDFIFIYYFINITLLRSVVNVVRFFKHWALLWFPLSSFKFSFMHYRPHIEVADSFIAF